MTEHGSPETRETKATSASPAAPAERSQKDSSTERPRPASTPRLALFEQVDASRFIRHPLLILLIGAILTGVAFSADYWLSEWVKDETVRQRLFMIFGLPAAASVFLTPLAVLASFPNRRRLIIGFLLPQLLATLITHLLKWSVGRARPYVEHGAWDFRSFAWIDNFEEYWLNGKFESFPSGHASAALTLALLLGIYFPRARWVFFFFAGLVGLERIVNHRHFLSDVLGGYVVALLSVTACVYLLGWRYYAKGVDPVPPTG